MSLAHGNVDFLKIVGGKDYKFRAETESPKPDRNEDGPFIVYWNDPSGGCNNSENLRNSEYIANLKAERILEEGDKRPFTLVDAGIYDSIFENGGKYPNAAE